MAPRSAFYMVISRQIGLPQCTSRAGGQFCQKSIGFKIKGEIEAWGSLFTLSRVKSERENERSWAHDAV